MWQHPARVAATQLEKWRSPDMRDAIYRADPRTLHAQPPDIDLHMPGDGPDKPKPPGPDQPKPPGHEQPQPPTRGPARL
eukprot:9838350-Alexandrium_andersonii.AAC.1